MTEGRQAYDQWPVASASGDGGGHDGGMEAGQELLERWIVIQREEIEETQRIHDLVWQQRRIGHTALQRAIDVRRRRNIRLVFPLVGEGMFLVPPLWAVTEGEILVGFALVEEL